VVLCCKKCAKVVLFWAYFICLDKMGGRRPGDRRGNYTIMELCNYAICGGMDASMGSATVLRQAQQAARGYYISSGIIWL
jgi:hypothetical protein